MDQPLVTTITSAYNSSRTLRVALESIRNQTYTNWESWVIGDACTDSSGDVVASLGDPRIHWHNLQRNYGSQWYPNNEGLRRATGKYVAFLGQDDIWLPDHLKDLVETLERTQAGFAHSICGIYGAEGWLSCVGTAPAGQNLGEHFIPPSSWMHRRDLVETVGYWADPSTLEIAMDFEWSRRAYRAGAKFAYCPRFSVVKIPSQAIGLYKIQGAPPQEELWRRIRDDLPAFEHELLGQIAAKLALFQWGRPEDPFWVAIRRVLGIIRRAMLRPVLNHPWLFEYRKKRFQQARAAWRPVRGLPRDHGERG